MTSGRRVAIALAVAVVLAGIAGAGVVSVAGITTPADSTTASEPSPAAGSTAASGGEAPSTFVTALEPDFRVTLEEDESTLSVPAGETATVVANVTNEGDSGGEAALEFAVEDEVIENRTVPLPAGGAETETFEWETPDEGGTFDATLTTQHDIVPFTIEATAPDDDDDDADDDDEADDVDDDADDADEPDEPGAPSFSLVNLAVPGEVEQNDTFDAAVGVTNVGNASGETTVELTFEDETVVENVSLDPGDSATVAGTFIADVDPGEYEVTAFETANESELSASISVVEPEPDEPPPEEPAFELSALEAPTEVAANESFEASVSVENVGNGSGETTVTVALGDLEGAGETITLDPDESETVTVELSADVDPGGHSVLASESATGATVERVIAVVEPAADDDADDADDEPEEDEDSFLSPEVLLGLVVAALLLTAIAVLVAQELGYVTLPGTGDDGPGPG